MYTLQPGHIFGDGCGKACASWYLGSILIPTLFVGLFTARFVGGGDHPLRDLRIGSSIRAIVSFIFQVTST